MKYSAAAYANQKDKLTSEYFDLVDSRDSFSAIVKPIFSNPWPKPKKAIIP